MAEAMKTRAEVDPALTWDLTRIFKTEETYEQAVEQTKRITAQIEENYKGKLKDASTIHACLDAYRELLEILDMTGSYSELAYSVDYTDEENMERAVKNGNLAAELMSRMTFIESELREVDDEVLLEAVKQKGANANFLKEILRNKPHALDARTEEALAALSVTLHAPYEIYEQIKGADMEFAPFTAHEKKYQLGYSLFENAYEYDNDTQVRREAFRSFSSTLRRYRNTTAAVYKTQVQTEKTISRLRGFDSVIDALLFEQHVTREMYDRQIDVIMERLAPHMRRYACLLKKIHHLDKMTYADLKISLDPEYDPEVTIEQSRTYVENGLAVLGEEYRAMVEEAYENRWVDFAVNKGKSTGGFCASPYRCDSYILLSWSGKMSEVFTLAHELGHAGNFRLCNRAQSIFDTRDSLYFQEAPSTMNELLMADYMKGLRKDKRFERWVLSLMITNTYYHNFVTHLLEAAYQREVYRIVDEGGNISAGVLDSIMRSVLERFWGDAVELIDGAELTWMRQPHYYMGLYSYTYSAGLTVGTCVSRRILEEGQPAIEDWLKVLAEGSHSGPVELARMAGVDITTAEPLNQTIDYIGSIIDRICTLTEELEAEQNG